MEKRVLYLSFGFLVAVVLFIVLQRFYGLVGNPVKVFVRIVYCVFASLKKGVMAMKKAVVRE